MDEFEETIEIPEYFVKFVIGKKGKQINQLRETYDCDIEIDDEVTYDGTQTCYITGAKANTRLAKNAIRKILERDDVKQTLEIPLDKCGHIIGKNGQTIKSLETLLEVKMHLKREKQNGASPLIITGAREKVEAACQAVRNLLEKPKTGNTPQSQPSNGTVKPKTSFLYFPTENFGVVQSELNRIRNESNARIIVPKNPSNNPTQKMLIIKGTPPQINDAKRLICQIHNKNNSNVSKSRSSQHGSKEFECGACFEKFYGNGRVVECVLKSTSGQCMDQSKDSHFICIPCIQSYANAAMNDIPVAFGGIGLNCTSPDCENVFLISSFDKYLKVAVNKQLKQRLQQQCIADAGLEDLVTCSQCGAIACVSPSATYYICTCRIRQCRNCPRIYDSEHFGKTCEKLDEEKEKQMSSTRRMESKISEAVIRKCFKCGIAFVKNDGCNKMECRCGGKQCYVCRAKNIDYSHFCQCGDLYQQHGACRICKKTCRLYEDAEELDQIKIRELQQQMQGHHRGAPITPIPRHQQFHAPQYQYRQHAEQFRIQHEQQLRVMNLVRERAELQEAERQRAAQERSFCVIC
uniref:RING-type domain-containing protein n=1 Tax=Panagrolaimus sp. ES5 TaxID=591445 RepID=A0AC34FNZ0_9BILA